jgi:hypothetical protein
MKIGNNIVLIEDQLRNWFDCKIVTQYYSEIVNSCDLLLEQDECEAILNKLWIYKTLLQDHQLYIDIFTMLKNRKYYDAWSSLAQLEIDLLNINNNKEYFTEDFGFDFLFRMTRFWQHLFPYRIFMSSREIIHKMECSICNKKIVLIGGCKHRKGKLYKGKLCLHIVKNFEVITWDVVENPVNKFSVFDHHDDDPAYFTELNYVLEYIITPHQEFSVNVFERKLMNHNGIYSPEYPCPCRRSMKSYSKCCLNKKFICIKHLDIDFPTPLAVKPYFQ